MPFQSIQLTSLFLIELQGAKRVVKVIIAVVNFWTFPSGLCSLFCGEGLRIVGRTGSSLCRELLFCCFCPRWPAPCYGNTFWLLVSHLYFAYSNIYSAEHGMWAAYKTECTAVWWMELLTLIICEIKPVVCLTTPLMYCYLCIIFIPIYIFALKVACNATSVVLTWLCSYQLNVRGRADRSQKGPRSFHVFRHIHRIMFLWPTMWTGAEWLGLLLNWHFLSLFYYPP